MKRGTNRDFIIAGVKTILRRNYGIIIRDTQEIDCKLGIGENIQILKDKYTFKVNMNEVDYL